MARFWKGRKNEPEALALSAAHSAATLKPTITVLQLRV